MINTLRSEWIKLRTITVHWVLVIIAVGFPLVVTTLVAIFGTIDSSIDSSTLSGLIVGLSIVSAMLFGAMAAISLTGEYSHSTIRPTYAATPNRLRVISAKLMVNTMAITVVSVVNVAVCWIVGSLILSSRGRSVSLGDSGVLASLISVCVLAVIVPWFAFGLGLAIRNAPATVTIVLLWPLLIENLIGLLFTLIGWDGATKWLPYQAALTATVDDSSTTDQLGRPGGLIYFAAVSLAIVAFGSWLDQRRDA
jgi:ABC-2 type transport system permease protein